jgi:Cu-Zn family superoxide dismutase
MRRVALPIAVLVAATALAARPASPVPKQAPIGTVAIAQLSPLGGSGVSGTVTFTVVDVAQVEQDSVRKVGSLMGVDLSHATVTVPPEHAVGVRVHAEIDGLTPGEHGIHVHEFGDCTAPDGSSCGGHFNPAGAKHGDWASAERHAGDFGNLVADEKGHATLDRCCFELSLLPGEAVVGRSVIVHGGKDDVTTQPSGNSGPRVACGLIEPKDGPTVAIVPPPKS